MSLERQPLRQTNRQRVGLLSVIMGDLANLTHEGPKWIFLDGDNDSLWIESLNTVMDTVMHRYNIHFSSLPYALRLLKTFSRLVYIRPFSEFSHWISV